MKIRPSHYRLAALRTITAYSDTHVPYCKQKNLRLGLTRRPRGAWVPLWVWVPEEAAQMEMKS